MVQLLQPNHHKVCVFKHPLILQWLTMRLLQNREFQSQLLRWCHDNDIHLLVDDDDDQDVATTAFATAIMINPRLRLLRYDYVSGRRLK